MSEPSPVVFQERPTANGRRLGIATLNAPKSLNALSQAMIDRLQPQLRTWAADPGLACVVLRGAGDKAFCAGGDLVHLYQSLLAHPGRPNPSGERFFATEYRLDYSIHTYPKPLLCWGNGIVMGGGLGLMAGASHRVVTETSRIAMPEIGIGLYPDVGGTWFLNRMPKRVGLYLGLTASACNAADALFVDLGDYFITHDQQAAVLDRLADSHWSDDPELNHGALSLTLRDFADRCREHLPTSLVLAHLDFINHVTDHPSVAGILNALTAADHDDRWLQKGREALEKGSPTSARVFFEQYRRGKHLSLKEAFMGELAMSIQFLRHPDFTEGVRALLIHKDRTPRWTPASITEVSDVWVEAHFALPPDYQRNPLADL